MTKLTAICEIQDISTGIEEVRLIDNTEEAMVAFEEEMEERMECWGYRISFFQAEIHNYENGVEVYRWMDTNKHLEIDRPL